jgi:hypothetical protein
LVSSQGNIRLGCALIRAVAWGIAFTCIHFWRNGASTTCAEVEANEEQGAEQAARVQLAQAQHKNAFLSQ